MSNNYVVIMAGGIGSRFWPASRSAKPKQFLDILGMGKSLIRLTFERFRQLVPASNILVVTHNDYRDLVRAELPELIPSHILCEPSRQNTAPCVVYAAFKIKELSPDANFVVAPSDHLILKEEAFLDKIKQGLDFVAKTPSLLTLGIQPTHPNTGYGYINFDKNSSSHGGIHPVLRFTEKPNLATAEAFIAGGEHLWNAGIFLWNVNTLLDAYREYAPKMYEQFAAIANQLNGPKETALISELYPQVEAISIDYAIMEKANNIFTLPADIGWSDIGTWGALHEILEKDEQQNSLLADAQQVILHESENCLLRSTDKKKLVVLGALNDYIVVDEEDVLLIYPKQREQEIKQLLKRVEDKFGGEYS